ncbi:MAG: 50S ribosomal protein L23 [Rhodospirillales bacterium 12-54-5]|nr:MAG: 50S ribosomal protein L23 [Rhodospirillales bacterium 12-54-5]
MTVAKKAAAPKAAKPAKKAVVASGLIEARLYDILVRPIVTEKSTAASELNKITFAISPTATKVDVKRAVEALFKVSVTKVNTINTEGKIKRFRGKPGQRSTLRKAIVTLAEGQSIDLAAGLK